MVAGSPATALNLLDSSMQMCGMDATSWKCILGQYDASFPVICMDESLQAVAGCRRSPVATARDASWPCSLRYDVS